MATWPDRPQSEIQVDGTAPVLEAERARIVARLRTECVEGRISLDRYSDLLGDAYLAPDRSSLDLVVRSLPVEAPAVAPSGLADVTSVRSAGATAGARLAAAAKARTWIVAVFGGATKRGRFPVADGTTAVGVFGDCTLDLSDATLGSAGVTIDAVAAFGQVTIIVPEGISVTLDGVSFFGDRPCRLAPVDDPDAPSIVVRAWAVFGEVLVRNPKPARSDRSSRRRDAQGIR